MRALIVTPTRELAAQVEQDLRTYGKHVALKQHSIFGGVGIQPQIDALRRGVDILVATPGRLLDHVQQKTVDLRQVEILVLDEADRMLDMGFIHDIRKILALLPATRQNLLFSATFPDEIRKLAGSFMKSPVTVEVARRNTPAELVAQVQHPVSHDRKRELLIHLVKSNDWRQVLVFCKTKHGANRLAQQLERAGVEADAIHGNKAQNHRTRTLARFKDNELRVLVATDIAARGLDIEALPHVVNYDMPHVAEDYVHRIGRTGRAGAEGEAVSLVTHEDRSLHGRDREADEPQGRAARDRRLRARHPQPEPGRKSGRKSRQPRKSGSEPEFRATAAATAAAAARPAAPPRAAPGPAQAWRTSWRESRGQSPRSPDSGSQRFNGQRRGGRPGYAAAAALPAPIAKEREAQIAEARARMVAEGEPLPAPKPAAAPSKRGRYEPQLGGALLGNKRTD